MSFLKDIIEAITGFFKRVPREIREAAEIGIKITKWLQKAVNNKTVVRLVEMTPTDIDDNILEALQRILPYVEEQITPTSESLILWLESLPDEARKAIYGHILGMITKELVFGEDITLSQAKMYSQIVFTKMKHELT